MAFRNMSAYAPTTLVEPYYECSYTWNQAFIMSIGNASASASLYTFGIMVVLIWTITFIAQRFTTTYIENPRVHEYHNRTGADHDKKIVHDALKRIILLGKADVLDPAFIELFKEDYDGDVELTKMSEYLKASSLDKEDSKDEEGGLEDDHLIDGQESKA